MKYLFHIKLPFKKSIITHNGWLISFDRADNGGVATTAAAAATFAVFFKALCFEDAVGRLEARVERSSSALERVDADFLDSLKLVNS